MVVANRSVELSIHTFQTSWKIITSVTDPPLSRLWAPPALFCFISAESEAVMLVPRGALASGVRPTLSFIPIHIPEYYVIEHYICFICSGIRCSFQNEAWVGYVWLWMEKRPDSFPGGRLHSHLMSLKGQRRQFNTSKSEQSWIKPFVSPKKTVVDFQPRKQAFSLLTLRFGLFISSANPWTLNSHW